MTMMMMVMMMMTLVFVHHDVYPINSSRSNCIHLVNDVNI